MTTDSTIEADDILPVGVSDRKSITAKQKYNAGYGLN